MRPPPTGTFALHLLDVGQGESILLDLPNGDFALIDAGPAKAAPIILDAVTIRIHEGRRFRFAAFTHWDADHIGALPTILRQHPPLEMAQPNIDLALIERLCAAYEKPMTPALFPDLRDAMRGIDPLLLGARQQIRDVGNGVEIWALSPAAKVRERIDQAIDDPKRNSFKRLRNDASLVLWIRAFGRSLLLPGEVNTDAAREMEQQFGGPARPGRVPHDDPRAHWLKLSHHGSKTGTNGAFLSIFAHDSFVASASHGARFDHPHPRVLHAVRECNGIAMCTNLGKGCHLTLQDPVQYPANDPSWADETELSKRRSITKRCFGTITVTVTPVGECDVSGAVAERPDCPYGGPRNASISL